MISSGMNAIKQGCANIFHMWAKTLYMKVLAGPEHFNLRSFLKSIDMFCVIFLIIVIFMCAKVCHWILRWEKETEGKKSETRAHFLLSSVKMQEQMAAKVSTVIRRQIPDIQAHHTNVSLIFQIQTALASRLSEYTGKPEATWIPFQRVSQDNFP